MCPYCHYPDPIFIESVVSPLNTVPYKLFNCPRCRLQYFTPLKFENIYEPDIGGLYNIFHEGRVQVPAWSLAAVQAVRRIGLDLADLKVMDIGAGDGINFEVLTKAGLKAKNYYSVELDKKSIKIAKKRGVLLKNITQKYFKTKSVSLRIKFDIVLATEVFEHQTNPRDFIKACMDLLRPNGILVMTVPDRNRLMIRMRSVPEDIPPHHFLRFGRDFFSDNFGNKLQYLGSYNYGIKDISAGAASLTRVFNLSKNFWPLFSPPIILLRLVDYFKGIGLVAVIKK